MPRRPSARVREQLFSAQVPANNPPRHFAWNWLAPVTVCAFTMLVVVGGRSHSGAHFGAPDTNLFFASMTMSSVAPNDSEPATAFALTKHDLNLEQNVWREAIFESTNVAQTHSSIRPLHLGRTNRLTL